MLGVFIAVLGVLVMGIVGVNGKRMIFDEIKTFGLQTVWVYRDNAAEQKGDLSVPGTGISYSDIESIRDATQHVKALSGVISKSVWIGHNRDRVWGEMVSVEPDYFDIENDTLVSGRFLTQQDADMSQRVCVIGQDLASRLFSGSALGQTLVVDNVIYDVVGVLAQKDRDLLKSLGIGGGRNPNDRVIVPLSVVLNEWGRDSVDYIQLSATETEASDLAAAEVKRLLRRNHHGQFEYIHVAMKNYIASFERMTRVISGVLAIAVLISLVIGGIGIANVMAVAVVERTKEIGIRKSLGATPRAIFQLFLCESILLTAVAGGLGIVAGSALGIVGLLLFTRAFVFPFSLMWVGFGVAVVTGLLSGVYPAMRAARKSPVEALRHD